MWRNIEKDMTEIVYDNKNLHITELEDKRPVLILFYLLVKFDPVGLGETDNHFLMALPVPTA